MIKAATRSTPEKRARPAAPAPRARAAKARVVAPAWRRVTPQTSGRRIERTSSGRPIGSSKPSSPSPPSRRRPSCLSRTLGGRGSRRWSRARGGVAAARGSICGASSMGSGGSCTAAPSGARSLPSSARRRPAGGGTSAGQAPGCGRRSWRCSAPWTSSRPPRPRVARRSARATSGAPRASSRFSRAARREPRGRWSVQHRVGATHRQAPRVQRRGPRLRLRRVRSGLGQNADRPRLDDRSRWSTMATLGGGLVFHAGEPEEQDGVAVLT